MKALTIALLFLTAITSAKADQLDDIKSRGKMTCGVLTGFEPFGFQDPNSRQLVGYEIDFCREFAKHLGVEADMKVVTTQGRIPELLQGRIDLLAALISYTKERAAQVDYTGLYIRSTNRFMVLKAASIKGPQDLAGKKIAVSKGSPLEQFLRTSYPASTVVSFDDKAASYLALKSGKVDALLTQTDTLIAMKNIDPKGDEIAILDESIYPTETSFIVRQNEPRFKAAANEFLESAEKSGLAERIFEKWLGSGSAYKMSREFKVGAMPH